MNNNNLKRFFYTNNDVIEILKINNKCIYRGRTKKFRRTLSLKRLNLFLLTFYYFLMDFTMLFVIILLAVLHFPLKSFSFLAKVFLSFN